MRLSSPNRMLMAAALVAASTVALGAQYELTVTQDRLINAQNEPQNWLLMNGDYGSQRYSKLTQIDRDNVGPPAHGLGAGPRRDAGHRRKRSGEREQPARRQRLPVHQ